MTDVDSLYTDGSFTNTGSIDVSSFFNEDQLDNLGSIVNVDSMYNNGTLTNAVDAVIEADSATNAGTLTK